MQIALIDFTNNMKKKPVKRLQRKKKDSVPMAKDLYEDDKCPLPTESEENLRLLSEYNVDSLQGAFDKIESGDDEEGTSKPGKPEQEVSPEMFGRSKTALNASFSQYRDKKTGKDSDSDDRPPGTLNSSGSDKTADIVPLPPLNPEEEIEQSDVAWIEIPPELRKKELARPLVNLVRSILDLTVDGDGEALVGFKTLDKKKKALGFVRMIKPTQSSCLLESSGVPDEVKLTVSGLDSGAPIVKVDKVGLLAGPKLLLDSDLSMAGPSAPQIPGRSIYQEQEWYKKMQSPGHTSIHNNKDTLLSDAEISKLANMKLTDGDSKSTATSSEMWDAESSSESESSDSSSEDESESEDEGYDVFMCPIFGTDEMSEKVFPRRMAGPYFRAGMSVPQAFQAVLKDQGILHQLEKTLDIAQTYLA